MKGIVFTEFMEMVQDRWGLEMLDRVIEDAALPNEGAYAATGTYDHAELVRMVVALSGATDLAVPDLVRGFGECLFQRFSVAYGAFFEGVHDAMSFLERVDGVMHVEVRKLYPDAELPSVTCERLVDGRMDVHYRSQRSFADLAEGLVAGCIGHFNDELDMQRDDRPCDAGNHVVFRLQPRRAA